MTQEQLEQAVDAIADFIYNEPVAVRDLLLQRRLITSEQAQGITLYDLNYYVLENLEDNSFQVAFDQLMESRSYSNLIVGLIVGIVSAVVSVVSAVHSGKKQDQAVKNSKLMGMIELEQNKRLAQEQIAKETDLKRKEILMNTLAEIRGAQDAAKVKAASSNMQMALIIGGGAFAILIFGVVIIKMGNKPKAA